MDKNIDEIYQAYLAKVYQNAQSYFSFTDQERFQFTQTGVSFTYGEMLYPSVKKLLNQLSLAENDVFLDLGSGLGKCALQVFMQTTLKKVIGIEAVLSLSEQAIAAAHEMKKSNPQFWEDSRELYFINGNFLSLSWDSATIVYTCSTCFREELLNAIGIKINQEEHVQHVFSLRPLPTLSRLPLKQVFSVECSWDSALCYHYASSENTESPR